MRTNGVKTLVLGSFVVFICLVAIKHRISDGKEAFDFSDESLANEFMLKIKKSKFVDPLKINDESGFRLLKSKYLQPPSSKPYNLSTDPSYLSTKTGYTWSFLDSYITLVFGNKTRGFFIEAGALDGEFLSNTLRLEKELNWTGLLVEPDPWNYQALVHKNRKAWTSNSCLSDKVYPKETMFISRQGGSNSDNKTNPWVYRGSSHESGYTVHPWLSDFKNNTLQTEVKVQCFPLLYYIVALNRPNIDLISLDIQGSELQVLKTFPFQRAKVKMFIVEFASSVVFDLKLEQFFEERGYQLIACDEEPNYIFISNEAFPQFFFPKVMSCNMSLRKKTS